MLNSNIILLVGLSEEDAGGFDYFLSGQSSEIIESDDYRKLMNSDYYVSIMDQANLDEDTYKELVQFYTEVDSNLTLKIIITEHPGELVKVSHALVFNSFEDLSNELSDILVKAYIKAKKEENTIRNFANSMMIHEQIQEHPVISTAELAHRIDRTEDATRRFIEILRTSGKNIDYDMKNKGWSVHHPKDQ